MDNSLKRLIFISILLGSLIVQAQSVSLLNKPLNDAVRRAQLLGDVPIASSFCIRPVDAVKALGFDDPYALDSKYDFVYNDKIKEGLLSKFSIPTSRIIENISDSLTKFIVNKISPNQLFYLRATPITTRVQYNGHHDYGWQDGPMIPNKGMQYYLNAGVYGRLGPIEFQYAPEIVQASNDSLPPPGARSPIGDNPSRFGSDVYTRNYLGQSYIRLNLASYSIGLSSENIFWGPGRFSGIVMSENAPGMKHFTFETNRPVNTTIGSFEFNLISGKKRRSGFSYLTQIDVPPTDSIFGVPSLPEVYRDQDLDTISDVFNGVVAVYSPIWIPGLSIGLTREIWTTNTPKNINYLNYIQLFYSNPFRSSGGGEQVNINQMASVFFRFVMQESHAEIYGEYGFDDNRYDLEDFLVSPEHSRAYMLGFRKIYSIKDETEYIDFTTEITQIEASKELMNRIQFGYAVFYDSDYSHYGQNIGAGIGTGSNQWIFNIDHVNKKRRLGFVFERVARNNDLLYTGDVGWVNTWYGFDFTKKYIEASYGFNLEKKRGHTIYWSKVLLTQTYNWNYWYSLSGSSSPMRADGYNLKSLNIFAGLTLLL